MSRIKRQQPLERIPVLGKIKIGQKDERGIPSSLDYFVADGKYKSLFDQTFGEKPKVLPIVFHSDNLDDVCNERLEFRGSDKPGAKGGGDLYAYGDGETFRIWDSTKKAYVITKTTSAKIQAAADTKGIKGTWKTVLTLRFIIPQIKTVLGVWQLTTRGDASSIPALVGTFDRVKGIATTVTRVPFDLSVDMAKSQKPGSASKYPVLSLTPNIGEEHLEKVRAYLEHGGKELRGLLTEETVERLALPEPDPAEEGRQMAAAAAREGLFDDGGEE